MTHDSKWYCLEKLETSPQNRIRAKVRVPADSAWFSGHFPGNPVLPGIARETIFNLAKKNHLDLKEQALRIDDLLEADEVFITNVIMKVMPVIHIEQHAVGESTVGPITQN